MNMKILLAGLMSGFASALLMLGSSRVGISGTPLLFATPLPIYFVALSFGPSAGMAGSIIAILVAGGIVSSQLGMLMGLLFSIPAAIAAHQANLAQQSEDGSMEWFPVSKILFNLSVVLCIAIIVAGYIVGFTPEKVLPVMKEVIGEFASVNSPDRALSEDEKLAIAKNFISILPFMFSGMWLVVHLLNMQVAGMISRSMKFLPRPQDDIAATASLPKLALITLPIALAATLMFDGPIQLVALVVAGMMFMAFALVGLAALHLRMRSWPGGLGILIITYLAIILFYFPLVIFAVAGVYIVFSHTNNSVAHSDKS